MQNTNSDYFAMLRSDYIAPKKDHYDSERRPYNRDNANGVQFIAATISSTPGEAINQSFSAGTSPSGKIELS